MDGEPLAHTLDELRVQRVGFVFEFSEESFGSRVVDVE